jgi:hypothetical protein
LTRSCWKKWPANGAFEDLPQSRPDPGGSSS